MVKQKETLGRVSFDFPFPEHFFKYDAYPGDLARYSRSFLIFGQQKVLGQCLWHWPRALNSMAMLQPISCRIFRIFIRIRCWALSMDLGGLSRIFAISV